VNKLIRAEWFKFRSLRFNWGIIGVALLLDIALLVVGLIFFNRSLGDAAPDTGADTRIEVIVSPLGILATVVGILGVLVMSSEYKSKTVIPSFAAAPVRSEVLASKAIVAAAVAFVIALIGTTINLVVGMINLSARGFSIKAGDDHFVQAVSGAIVLTVLFVLFGLGLGILFKNAVLSITLIVAIPAVAEPALAGFLPDWIDRYLPFLAGSALTSPGGTDQLSAWQGGGVLGLWTVVLLIAAAIVFERRDLGNTG
jgi:ABC-type transport system involved in multi-copper enzyme maturation permease subunit